MEIHTQFGLRHQPVTDYYMKLFFFEIKSVSFRFANEKVISFWKFYYLVASGRKYIQCEKKICTEVIIWSLHVQVLTLFFFIERILNNLSQLMTECVKMLLTLLRHRSPRCRSIRNRLKLKVMS